MHIIKVKYLSPTDHKGSRLKCSFVGWEQKKSRVYAYPYSSGNAFEQVATQYLEFILGDDMAEFNFNFGLIGSSYDSNSATAYVVFTFKTVQRHVMVTERSSVTV